MDLYKKKPSIHFCHLYHISSQTLVGFMFGFMVFKATFSNISVIVISLLLFETGVPGETQRPVANY